MVGRLSLSVLFLAVISACSNPIVRLPQQVGGDVGMRHIEVRDLTFKNAIVGTTMSFKGTDALSLYGTLPKVLIENDPEEATGFVATDKINAVSIKCQKSRYSEANQAYVRINGGPLCTIRINDGRSVHVQGAESKWIQVVD